MSNITIDQRMKARTKSRISDIDDDDIPLIRTSSGHVEEIDQGQDDFWVKIGLKKRQFKSRSVYLPGGTKSSFPPNLVRNQKYSIFTFLPLVLFEQFKFFFNLYFLLVALSQLIPQLQIGYLFTYFAPLAFVLSVTIAKEAYDDYIRFKRDQEANSQLYEVLVKDGSKKTIASSDLKVGDLVIVKKDQRVPADLVLLRTTEKSGACFIRTDQLDGETDWKLRLAVPSCQQLTSDHSLVNSDINGVFFIEKPEKDIYCFVGTFRHFKAISTSHGLASESLTEAIDVENTLWANTVVASGTAIGMVVYTGEETRAVMNTSTPHTKTGLIDLEINFLSKILCVVTFGLALTLIALSGFSGYWYIYLMRFLILFSSIIPISLRVNLDLGKTVYSYLIMRDNNIPETIVRTSTIPEELGRVEYLLTDKTGTLTRNEMELKKLHMGTLCYGLDSVNEIIGHLDRVFVHYKSYGEGSSGSYQASAQTGGKGRISVQHGVSKPSRHRDISTRVTDILLALALCHNVTPVLKGEDDDSSNVATSPSFSSYQRGSINYQASSPDEVAIVKWTELVGLMLVQRDMSSITLKYLGLPDQSKREEILLSFDILQVFPFTSETKRMGIIVRDKSTNEILFFMKGADAVMSKIVQYNDWLDEECGNMAREGLRTLVIARRKLSDEFYREFEGKYHKAKVSVNDRNANIQNVISSMLENELELLGLTGVEDKLQEDVKTTLETLKNAGIKIWMLTGDKIETATNIAVSSKLVAKNQNIVQIQKIKDLIEAEQELDRLSLLNDACLVIDGQSLQLFVDHLTKKFMDTAISLPAVVCCRCSPTQKATVTTLIKNYTNKRVCAIGDGGNDVSMIQAAHVGVGIVGKEGKQASLAADFSIIQFSYLTRLLLWHGRNSYKRSAKLSQFVIHRGLIISIIQAVFSAIFYYAPIALYQGFLLVGYSTIFTMAPVFSLVLDIDVTDETALLYPELYKELTKGRSLSLRTFFTWFLISVYQGSVIMMLGIWLFEEEFVNIVAITFTALVFNELLMVAFEITTWHSIMIYSEVATFLIYLASMAVLKTEFDLSFILTWRFVWKTLVITVVSCFPLYVLRFLRRAYAPPVYAKLQN